MATDKAIWYRLDAADLLIEVMECASPEEWYRRSLAIAKALVRGEEGVDGFADKMIEERHRFSEKRRAAGIASGEARRLRASEGEDGTSVEQNEQVLNNAEPDRRNGPPIINNPVTPSSSSPQTDGRTDGTDGRTDGNGAGNKIPPIQTDGRTGTETEALTANDEADAAAFSEGFRDDWRGYVYTIMPFLLPAFAAWYCGEMGNMNARKRYEKAILKRGDRGFRDLLDTFIGAIEAGEEPQNRGRALMARVKEWQKGGWR